MRLIAEIIGLWIVASCIIGPCLTWLFYYGKRGESINQESVAAPSDIPEGAIRTAEPEDKEDE